VTDEGAYLNAIECMNRCSLSVMMSFSKERMWEQRNRGEVCADDLDF
jgi:hypothetical protein